MVQVRRGDHAAFGRLVSRHLPSVHRYLTRLTATSADADDLAQETFLRLWSHAASYRPGAVRLTTWLHRIAHNLAVDEFRKRRGDDETRPGPEPEEQAIVDPLADPETQLAGQRLQRQLDAALEALPENQRAALLLCQVQGFSNAQAADILGVSVASLESLLARARRALRQRLIASAATTDNRGAAPGAMRKTE